MNDCPGIVSEKTTVYIQSTTPTPKIIGDPLICEGEDLTFALNNENNLMTIWYYAPLEKAVDTTYGNQWIVENINSQDAGEYYAIYVVNGCQSSPSNRVEVAVVSGADLVANAGQDAQFCTAETLTLKANRLNNTSGRWTTLTGATIINPDTNFTSATNISVGDNVFVWTVQNICGATTSDTLTLNVLQTGETIADAGLDINVCEQVELNLAANVLVNTTGRWSQSQTQANQTVNILNPEAANSSVTGLEIGNTYRFFWTLSSENCPNFSRDEVLVTIDEKPAEVAMIPLSQQPITACLTEEINLKSTPALFGVGEWTGPALSLIHI